MSAQEQSYQEQIKTLEAQLEALRAKDVINSAPLSYGIVNSSALPDVLQKGTKVIYIYNRQDAVPAIIESIHRDREVYDIAALIPNSNVKIEWSADKRAYNRVEKVELVERLFQRVRLDDPRKIFVKTADDLAAPVRGTEGIIQSQVTRFREAGTLLTVPRFHDWHTSIIGTFFDPSMFKFRIRCWRAATRVENQMFPAVEEIFPKNKKQVEGGDFYLDFAKCFNRYFKEYHLGRSKAGEKWNSVEIQTFLVE